MPLDSSLPRRPRLALAFTLLTQPGIVRLVAGEDFRYTLTHAGLDEWLPGVLRRCTGGETIEQLLGDLPDSRRATLLQILRRLQGERVLVEGPAEAAHVAHRYRWQVEGDGLIADRLRGDAASEGEPLVVLVQDRLDYAATLDCQRRCRNHRIPWLWVSTGAMQRGYVGPLLLPDAGPCFGCLLRSFRRLSPAPEIYDALLDHAPQGSSFARADFIEEGLLILQGLVAWKLRLAEQTEAPVPLYRLHVLETATMEVTTHRVAHDPECPECGWMK
jgi:bacteriocin biosynthesis cyclodehydratase domain-containing protein